MLFGLFFMLLGFFFWGGGGGLKGTKNDLMKILVILTPLLVFLVSFLVG
jgi:hypothetical protein